jgi:hypothetical protein
MSLAPGNVVEEDDDERYKRVFDRGAEFHGGEDLQDAIHELGMTNEIVGIQVSDERSVHDPFVGQQVGL